MSLEDVATYLAAALLIAAVFYIPKKISARQRLRVGLALFVGGWAGVFATLGLAYLILQSELAYALMGLSCLAILLSLLFLVTALFDWMGLTRPRRQRFRLPPFDT